MLNSVPNSVGIVDDILCHGNEETTHDVAVITLLETARVNNLTFNANKFVFKSQDCVFFGGNLTPAGYRMDPEKVQAITEMKPPENLQDLQSLLVLVNKDWDWDWDVMADGHVVIGLSLFIVLVASRFHLPSFDISYSVVKPSLWTTVLSYRIFSIKLSCYHRVKNPAVKWTKRGSTMIHLAESTYVSCFACTESILLCGDIHPYPGPNNPERLSIGTNVDSGKLMPARITYSARQLLSFNFQHGAHVIGDLALACIQQAGILRGSTNHIVTPSSIQVHVTEFCLRCSPRRLNHANWANCINLSPMADYANNPTRFRCSPETHHSRQSIVTSLSRNSATRPSASFIRRGEDRSKRCHLRSIPLSCHVKKKGYDFPSFYLANARSLEKKFDELTAQHLSTRMDIAVIAESWFNDRIDDSVLIIPGYVLQRRDRPTRGGGVYTFVYPASPSKGGLIWSHQIMNACGCGFVLRACLVHSLVSSLVLCTPLKHPLTYNGLVLVISSSVLTLLSPLSLTAG